jgi:hypothetical protein
MLGPDPLVQEARSEPNTIDREAFVLPKALVRKQMGPP